MERRVSQAHDAVWVPGKEASLVFCVLSSKLTLHDGHFIFGQRWGCASLLVAAYSGCSHDERATERPATDSVPMACGF